MLRPPDRIPAYRLNGLNEKEPPMNLKLIDAAIAAYSNDIDEADKGRLDFFRALWEVQSDCESAGSADAYVMPDEKALVAAYAQERPILTESAASIDAEALSSAAERLCAIAIEREVYDAAVAEAFGRVKWDRVFRAADMVLAGADPDAWLADVFDVLKDDGMAEDTARLATLFASMALKAQLAPVAAHVMAALKKAHVDEPRPLACPVCGSVPALAHVGGDTSSNGRGRLLVCSQCAAAWEFERVRCARCGSQNQAHLHFFNIEGDDAHRIATCDECGGYMRTLYSEDALAPVAYEVEDVVMARLDAIAQDPRFSGGSDAAEAEVEATEPRV